MCPALLREIGRISGPILKTFILVIRSEMASLLSNSNHQALCDFIDLQRIGAQTFSYVTAVDDKSCDIRVNVIRGNVVCASLLYLSHSGKVGNMYSFLRPSTPPSSWGISSFLFLTPFLPPAPFHPSLRHSLLPCFQPSFPPAFYHSLPHFQPPQGAVQLFQRSAPTCFCTSRW